MASVTRFDGDKMYKRVTNKSGVAEGCIAGNTSGYFGDEYPALCEFCTAVSGERVKPVDLVEVNRQAKSDHGVWVRPNEEAISGRATTTAARIRGKHCKPAHTPGPLHCLVRPHAADERSC